MQGIDNLFKAAVWVYYMKINFEHLFSVLGSCVATLMFFYTNVSRSGFLLGSAFYSQYELWNVQFGILGIL